jgi:transcriptional regulator NrdR family protein
MMPFNRDKIFMSIHKSLGHREDALASATALVETVIGGVMRQKNSSAALPVELIANLAYMTLKRFDPLAAHSYKAYHRAALR